MNAVLPDANADALDAGGAVDSTDAAAAIDAADVGAMADAADVGDAAETGKEVSPMISVVCGLDLVLDDACGSLCQALNDNCTGSNSQFSDFQACDDLCLAPKWSCGSPGDQGVDTVFCRVAHAMAAGSASDKATECQNAGPDSPNCR